MKIGIDIGGVISRYPNEMKQLILAFAQGGHEIYVVTDMTFDDALAALARNGMMIWGVTKERIISCDWSKHGDMCKAERIKELGLDMMFDDRLDYVFDGAPVSWMLVPRPNTPYYHPTWQNTASMTVCVAEEEYQAFQKWRKSKEWDEMYNKPPAHIDQKEVAVLFDRLSGLSVNEPDL